MSKKIEQEKIQKIVFFFVFKFLFFAIFFFILALHFRKVFHNFMFVAICYFFCSQKMFLLKNNTEIIFSQKNVNFSSV